MAGIVPASKSTTGSRTAGKAARLKMRSWLKTPPGSALGRTAIASFRVRLSAKGAAFVHVRSQHLQLPFTIRTDTSRPAPERRSRTARMTPMCRWIAHREQPVYLEDVAGHVDRQGRRSGQAGGLRAGT